MEEDKWFRSWTSCGARNELEGVQRLCLRFLKFCGQVETGTRASMAGRNGLMALAGIGFG